MIIDPSEKAEVIFRYIHGNKDPTLISKASNIKVVVVKSILATYKIWESENYEILESKLNSNDLVD